MLEPIFAAVLGCFMGSGLNCLAHRMARGQKWSEGRSRCPSCNHVLHFYDLIPLVSYLMLRGTCRYCGAKISVRYFAAELILGLCYGTVTARYGISLNTLTHLVLCSCLFCLSLIDLEIQIIPHRFLAIPALLRLIQLIWEGGLSGLWTGFWPGLLLGSVVLVLSLILDRVLGKESLGGGDIKLLFMLGLYFPISQCLLLVMLACGIGIAVLLISGRRESGLPFGPALSIAAWLTMLFGEKLVIWYLGLF